MAGEALEDILMKALGAAPKQQQRQDDVSPPAGRRS